MARRIEWESCASRHHQEVSRPLAEVWDQDRNSDRAYNAACTRRVFASSTPMKTTTIVAGLILVGACASARPSKEDEVLRAQRDQADQLEAACERQQATACTRMGRLLETGNAARPKDEARAAAVYQIACDQGEVTGCTGLASLLRRG